VGRTAIGHVTSRVVLEVPADLAGERLDRALAALRSDWTRSQARRLIDEDRVRVNGDSGRPAHRVDAGDHLEIDVPEPRPAAAEAQPIRLEIIHEDDDLIVIDKPAGLVIHPAAGNPDGTLVNALLHHCRDLSGIGGVERPGIVHRLDKDTTGLIVAAKNDRAHLGLSLAFRRRSVEKSYLAVCYGRPCDESRVIDAPIGRHARERRQMAVVTDGRPARTLLEVREHLSGASLLACRLVTGRTHQIRVHLAHIGHALVGDPLYAGRQWRNLPPPLQGVCRDFPRQALHAWKLAFEHPVTRRPVAFEAPIPEDMVRLVSALRLR
jgi:23S rRNA pseudouridine1911/1915/1917 synthase